jgi:formimidoylglutamate deiminase
VGALEVGRRADWIVLDAGHCAIAGQAPESWLSGVVFCEHGTTPVMDVWVGGRKVIEGRRHRDEESAFGRYRETLGDLLDSDAADPGRGPTAPDELTN